jgi:hypothetical protein
MVIMSKKRRNIMSKGGGLGGPGGGKVSSGRGSSGSSGGYKGSSGGRKIGRSGDTGRMSKRKNTEKRYDGGGGGIDVTRAMWIEMDRERERQEG